MSETMRTEKIIIRTFQKNILYSASLYPTVKEILECNNNSPQALKNQSELVQTPGLFDSPLEQNRGRGLSLVEDDPAGKTNIVDNHIISY